MAYSFLKAIDIKPLHNFEGRVKTARYIKVLTALVMLTGVLMNTSVINVPLVIPVYWLGILLSLFLILLKKRITIPMSALWVPLTGIAILMAVSALHSFVAGLDPVGDLLQTISRGMLYTLFAAVLVVMNLYQLREWAIRCLVILILFVMAYGFYEFFAKKYGLPLFLSDLRNSSSFYIDTDLSGGWANTVRVSTIYAEPSFVAFPLAIIFWYLIFVAKKSSLTVFLWTATIIYSILSFSRLSWAVLSIGLLFKSAEMLTRKIKLKSQINEFSRQISTWIITVLMSSAALYALQYATKIFSDSSVNGRAQSITVGLRIWLDSFWLGTGANSYVLVSPNYIFGFINYIEEPIVHNVFISYAQQFGIFGLMLSVIPFSVIVASKIKGGEKFFLITVVVTLFSLGGDVAYFSIFWIFLAILSAKTSILETK